MLFNNQELRLWKACVVNSAVNNSSTRWAEGQPTCKRQSYKIAWSDSKPFKSTCSMRRAIQGTLTIPVQRAMPASEYSPNQTSTSILSVTAKRSTLLARPFPQLPTTSTTSKRKRMIRKSRRMPVDCKPIATRPPYWTHKNSNLLRSLTLSSISSMVTSQLICSRHLHSAAHVEYQLFQRVWR